MTIRRTTATIILVTVLGLIFTADRISRAVITDGFAELEEASAQRDFQRARYAIDREVQRLEVNVTDWAYWDDTYEFVAEGNADYIAINVEPNTLESLDINLFAIVLPGGALYFHRVEDRITGEPLPFPSSLIPALAIPSEPGELQVYEFSGVVGLPAVPVAVAARPILTSLGEGPPMGVLIMGTFLDARAVERLSAITLLNLSVDPGESAAGITRESDESLVIREPLATAAGDSSYTLAIDLPRDIAQRGHSTRAALVVAVGTAGVGFGILVFVLLELAVVRRLSSLGRAMARLGERGDLSARLTPQGTDEVGRLAKDINTTLDSLEQSEAQFSRLVESASDAIILLRDGAVSYANPTASKLFGMGTEALVKQPAASLLPPDVQAAILRLESSRGTESLESTLTHDGGTRRIEVSLGNVVTREGPGIQVVIRDISERARAEEQRLAVERKIQEAQRLESLGLLAGGIAHDFNNLLMAILGNASLARISVGQPDETEEALAEIESAATRASELTRQLLAYAGRGRLIVSSFDISHLVSETVSLVRRIAGIEPNIQLDLAPSLPPIEGDETQVRQVVMNLLTNALDATAVHDGRVWVSTSLVSLDAEHLAQLPFETDARPGNYIRLEVSDSGPGISTPQLSQIFEPFYSTKGAGRGLGLAAVKGILRGHGGTITVESPPGSGALFTVYLPGAGTPVSPREPAPAPARLFTGRALAVDDEAAVLGVASRMLSRLGYSVVTASDGDEAVQLAQGSDFDVVLLDVAMPRMSGIDAFRHIRKSRAQVPVVLMSGHTFQELPDDVATDPRLTFIQKPFTFVSLSSAISAIAVSSPPAG